MDGRRRWTLLTSHGHVLVEIARNPQVRVREISAAIGITERAIQAIVADLERAGYVERVRVGRRTHYVVHTDNPFRHSAQDGLRVGPFLELLTRALAEPDGSSSKEGLVAAVDGADQLVASPEPAAEPLLSAQTVVEPLPPARAVAEPLPPAQAVAEPLPPVQAPESPEPAAG